MDFRCTSRYPDRGELGPLRGIGTSGRKEEGAPFRGEAPWSDTPGRIDAPGTGAGRPRGGALLLVALAALLGGVGCSEPESGEEDWRLTAVVQVGSTLWSHADAVPAGAWQPLQVSPAGGGLILADGVTGSALLLDPEGSLVRSVGRRGPGGPGEFRTPGGAVLAADGSIWVADRPGGRTILFDSAGVPVRTVRSFSRTFGVLPGGDLVFPPISNTPPAPLLVQGDHAAPLDVRMSRPARQLDVPAALRWAISASSRGEVALLDQAGGDLWVLEEEGGAWSGRALSLPDVVMRDALALHERRLEMSRGMRGSGVYIDLFSQMHHTPDDRIWIGVGSAELMGVLLDHRAKEATLFLPPPATELRGLVATSPVHGREVLAVYRDEVRRLVFEPVELPAWARP